jgi:hypothetical protein
VTPQQEQKHDDAILTVLALYGAAMFTYGRATRGADESAIEMMRDLAHHAARGALSALLINPPTDEDVAEIVTGVHP